MNGIYALTVGRDDRVPPKIVGVDALINPIIFFVQLIRVTAFELNTPQRSDFRPIEAFFSSPYESMPSEKKHSAESKLRPFRCFAVLKEQIFVTARRKSARNTRLFQRFSTKLWRKYAFQNRMEFECSHSTVGTDLRVCPYMSAPTPAPPPPIHHFKS